MTLIPNTFITRSLHEGFADFLLVADTPHLLNSDISAFNIRIM